MSVFKRPGRAAYSYDFRLANRRYSGSTGATEKRAAERHEAEIKAQARLAQKTSDAPLALSTAVSRYWLEVGQHHKRAPSTLTDLAWLERQLGKTRLVASITSADVARLIARRRLDEVLPATINRGVTQRLRAVLTRCTSTWGVSVKNIKWGDLMLPEPQERVRELHTDEEARLFEALRDDYQPIVRFALLTGCRKAECCALTWRQIDWHNRQFRVVGKGDKTRTIPMTNAIYTLLRALPRAHSRVFTFKSQRADFAPRGERHPVEMNGLRSAWDLALRRADIENFRFHDLRHTCATRLLRQSGNLRLVQQLLGHSDISTTLKYAHATLEDLRSAMSATDSTTTDSGSTSKPLGDSQDIA